MRPIIPEWNKVHLFQTNHCKQHRIWTYPVIKITFTKFEQGSKVDQNDQKIKYNWTLTNLPKLFDEKMPK